MSASKCCDTFESKSVRARECVGEIHMHARTQPANWIELNWKIQTIDSVRPSFVLLAIRLIPNVWNLPDVLVTQKVKKKKWFHFSARPHQIHVIFNSLHSVVSYLFRTIDVKRTFWIILDIFPSSIRINCILLIKKLYAVAVMSVCIGVTQRPMKMIEHTSHTSML